MLSKSKYLDFNLFPGLKTDIVDVRSKRTGFVLGRIRWYSWWRQYCFYPTDDTIFNSGCMADIISCIDALRIRRLKRKTKKEK